MKPNFYTRTHKILRYLAIAVALWYGGWMVTALFFGFPIPRGTKIDPDYNSYYKNIRGVYDIDAPTFRPIDDKTFEDKNYIYTIKNNAWAQDDPFERKKKHP